MKKIFFLVLCQLFNAFAATHTVTTTADSGVGSLRQAILDANVDPTTPRTIVFSIAPGGVQTISPLTALPSLTASQIIIDGSSQPGWTLGDPQIVIDGANAGFGFDGFTIDGADNCVIQDLVINNGFNFGITLSNAANSNSILGCFIGVDQAGTAASPNIAAIMMSATGAVSNNNNRFGAANHGNVCSGNLFAGLILTGNMDSTIVESNFIGTNKSGTAALGNAQAGVGILSFPLSSPTDIATNTQIINNVVSGNSSFPVNFAPGIFMGFQNVQDTVIQGNKIGVDITGTIDIHNDIGITVFTDIATAVNGTIIGGSNLSERNIISSNLGGGVGLQINCNNSVIKGNYIGVDVTGTVAMGNGGGGVSLQGNNNIVGGSTAAERNIISNTLGGSGISFGANSSNNIVTGNYLGVDVTGTVPMGNGNNGIDISGYVFDTQTPLPSNNNIIGGPLTGERNIVSNNTNSGILLNLGVNDTVIQNNYIGVDVSGIVAAGNGNVGIQIQGFDYTNQIPVPSNGTIIGGANAGEGNVISNNTQQGIQLNLNCNNTIIKGNYIGVDATGTVDLGNGNDGIQISGYDFGDPLVPRPPSVQPSNNTIIGGATVAERNIISNNNNDGIQLNLGVNDSVITGNYIGVDTTGTVNFGNGNVGIQIFGYDNNNQIVVGSNRTQIGGAATGESNIIAGHFNQGIQLNQGVNDTVIKGNHIGVDVNGTNAIPNLQQGIQISGYDFTNQTIIGANGTLIGGTTATERNIVSGNGNTGVQLNLGIDDTVITGNYIGVDATGLVAIPNAQQGIQITGYDFGNNVPAACDNTQIGGSVAERNIISGNLAEGIQLNANVTNTVIQSNYIGVGVDGATPLGNANQGIHILGNAQISCDGTIIGGAVSGQGNIISDNVNDGIFLNRNVNNTVIKGNLIGTDSTGAINLGNGLRGIEIVGDTGQPSDSTVIGGATAAESNVISGSAFEGIFLQQNVSNTLIQGNYIGTNSAGTAALPNGSYGIYVNGNATFPCLNTRIGGPSSSQGNVISGNALDGIWLNASVNDSTMQGNFIGTDKGATIDLGNGDDGIQISGNNGAPCTNNLIGGTDQSERNIIKFNTNFGVNIGGDGTTPDILNPVLGNPIYLNGDSGIRLVADGNNSQEAPTVNSAQLCPSSQALTVTITAPATPAATTFRLEIFVNSVNRNPITEGELFVGAITPVASGDTVTQSFVVPVSVVPGQWVSATATNLNNAGGTPGDTSEFSLNVPIQSQAPTTVLSADPTSICIGSSSTLTATITGTGPYNILWSDGFVQTGVTSPAMRVVSPTTTTVYSAVVTDTANGCAQASSNSVTVTVNNPDVTTPDFSVCLGSSYNFQLTASGGSGTFTTYTITQQPTNGTITPTSNSTGLFTFTGTSVGTSAFDFTVTDSNGCTSSPAGTANATVNPLPDVTTADFSVCLGSSHNFQLTASGGSGTFTTYTITQQPTNGTITPTSNSTGLFTFTGATVGTSAFDFTVTDSNGCTSSPAGSANATVNSLPTAEPATSSVCQGNTVNGILDATGGTAPYTFTLVSGPTNGSATVSGSSVVQGSYSYTNNGTLGNDSFVFRATDSNGCFSDAAVTITINANPTANPATFEVAINDTLTGQLTASNGIPPYVFSLNDVPAHGTVTVNADGTFTYTPDMDFAGVDSFTFFVTDSVGCVSVPATVTITVFSEQPSVILLASKLFVVTDESFLLQAIPSGLAPFTLIWSDGLVQTGVTGPVCRVVTPLVTTTYTVTVIDRIGNSAISNSVTVLVENICQVSPISIAVQNKYRPKLNCPDTPVPPFAYDRSKCPKPPRCNN